MENSTDILNIYCLFSELYIVNKSAGRRMRAEVYMSFLYTCFIGTGGEVVGEKEEAIWLQVVPWIVISVQF